MKYEHGNFYTLRKHLGRRPGNKAMDPYYLKKGWNNKPMVFLPQNNHWYFVKDGDDLEVDEATGDIIWIKADTAPRAVGEYNKK